MSGEFGESSVIPQIDLELLRCPTTHRKLAWASVETVRAVREKLGLEGEESGRVAKRSNWTAALVTDDGALLYPVANGIPKLLASEAIDLASLNSAVE